MHRSYHTQVYDTVNVYATCTGMTHTWDLEPTVPDMYALHGCAFSELCSVRCYTSQLLALR